MVGLRGAYGVTAYLAASFENAIAFRIDRVWGITREALTVEVKAGQYDF